MKKMNLADTFTEYLDAATGTRGGYKFLPKTLFPTLCEKVKTSEDVDSMKDIISDFLFHRNKIPNVMLDEYMRQGLAIDPVKMLDLFHYHRQIFYYPHQDVIDSYANHFATTEDYENTTK